MCLVGGGVEGKHGDDAADGDRDAGRAQQRRGAAGGRPAAARTAAARAAARRARSARPGAAAARAASASALTVLVRAARMAGTSVAASATASATATTTPGGGGGERRRARGADQGGAGTGEQRRGQPAGQPARPPPRARARTRFSASSTAATRPGVPPTALSSPTRRVCSAIRPPDQHGHAGHREQAGQPARRAAGRAARPGPAGRPRRAMPCHGISGRSRPAWDPWRSAARTGWRTPGPRPGR